MKIHGEWEVSQVRNVVVRAFAGNFNEQGVRAMFEDYKAIAPTGVAWASLAQGEYWEMAPTAALKAYTSMRDWAISMAVSASLSCAQAGFIWISCNVTPVLFQVMIFMSARPQKKLAHG
jgi:hypothetical protein